MGFLAKRSLDIILLLVTTVSGISWAQSTVSELENEILLLEKQIDKKPVRKTLPKQKSAKRVIPKSLPPKRSKVVKVRPVTSKPIAKLAEPKTVEVVSPPNRSAVIPGAHFRRNVPKKRNFKKIGINVIGYYSFANQFKTTNNSADSHDVGGSNHLVDYTGEYASSSAMGIGVEYSRPDLLNWSSMGLGFDAGLNYEFNRKISRDYLNRNSSAYYGSSYQNYYYDDPELSLILPYVNASLNFSRTYMFAGLNYSVPKVSNADDENFKGKMGYQVGFGAFLTSSISMEVSHRWVSFDVEPIDHGSYFYSYNNAYNDEYRLNRSGLGVKETETLDLNGLNIAFKIGF